VDQGFELNWTATLTVWRRDWSPHHPAELAATLAACAAKHRACEWAEAPVSLVLSPACCDAPLTDLAELG
jgi:hypothetical protein